MSIGVSSWEETYAQHRVSELIEATIKLIDTIEPPDDNATNLLSQIRATFQLILEWRETPSLLISQSMLGSFDTAIRNNIKSQLDAYGNSRNSTHLQNAYANLGTALEIARGWPPTKDRYAKGLITTIQEVERDAQNSLNTLQAEIETISSDLDDKLREMQADIETRDRAANERLQQLTNEVVAAQQKLDQYLNTANQIDTRISAVSTQQQTAFTTAETKRQEAHTALLDEHREALEQAQAGTLQKSDQRLKSFEYRADDLVGNLIALETEAKNLVEATSEAATTTDYGKYAEAEKKTADRLRIAAAVILVLGGLAVVGILIYEHYDGGAGQTWLIKSALSFPFVAAAWYLIRESSRHRDEAELAKDTQLKILALNPFIVNMEEEDQRELRKAAATELFVTDRRLRLRSSKKEK